MSASEQGFECVPKAEKLLKWTATCEKALEENVLLPGIASKLAGALSWASQNMFNRLGRAMLRPLFTHKCKYGRLPRHVRLCLEWWTQVMRLEISQLRKWSESERSVVQLFVDARGTPPRLGAVIAVDNRGFYSDMEPSEDVLKNFRKRNDSQIMGLELLAIAFGLSSFLEMCAGRTVRVWSDNVGAESCARRGSAKSFDHNCIVHCIWLFAAKHGINLRIDRVPTKDNISDLPSREEYGLL